MPMEGGGGGATAPAPLLARALFHWIAKSGALPEREWWQAALETGARDAALVWPLREAGSMSSSFQLKNGLSTASASASYHRRMLSLSPPTKVSSSTGLAQAELDAYLTRLAAMPQYVIRRMVPPPATLHLTEAAVASIDSHVKHSIFYAWRSAAAASTAAGQRLPQATLKELRRARQEASLISALDHWRVVAADGRKLRRAAVALTSTSLSSSLLLRYVTTWRSSAAYRIAWRAAAVRRVLQQMMQAKARLAVTSWRRGIAERRILQAASEDVAAVVRKKQLTHAVHHWLAVASRAARLRALSARIAANRQEAAAAAVVASLRVWSFESRRVKLAAAIVHRRRSRHAMAVWRAWMQLRLAVRQNITAAAMAHIANGAKNSLRLWRAQAAAVQAFKRARSDLRARRAAQSLRHWTTVTAVSKTRRSKAVGVLEAAALRHTQSAARGVLAVWCSSARLSTTQRTVEASLRRTRLHVILCAWSLLVENQSMLNRHNQQALSYQRARATLVVWRARAEAGKATAARASAVSAAVASRRLRMSLLTWRSAAGEQRRLFQSSWHVCDSVMLRQSLACLQRWRQWTARRRALISASAAASLLHRRARALTAVASWRDVAAVGARVRCLAAAVSLSRRRRLLLTVWSSWSQAVEATRELSHLAATQQRQAALRRAARAVLQWSSLTSLHAQALATGTKVRSALQRASAAAALSRWRAGVAEARRLHASSTAVAAIANRRRMTDAVSALRSAAVRLPSGRRLAAAAALMLVRLQAAQLLPHWRRCAAVWAYRRTALQVAQAYRWQKYAGAALARWREETVRGQAVRRLLRRRVAGALRAWATLAAEQALLRQVRLRLVMAVKRALACASQAYLLGLWRAWARSRRQRRALLHRP